MVRKRLSDMLREEAQKPVETESESALTDQAPVSSAGAAQSKPAAKPKSTTTGSRAASASQSSIAAKAEATAIAPEVTRLKAELETAAKQVADLNQQITDLKAELGNQSTAAKKLQTNSEKAEQRSQQLETELSEAKQTILQLAEVNSQLKQDLTAKPTAAIPETLAKLSTGLRREIAPPLKTLPATLPTVPAEANPAEAKKNTRTALSQQDLLRRQQKSLAHPVFPAGNPPGHLSEQDLGWVD